MKKKYRRYNRQMNTGLTKKQMDNLYDNMVQRCSKKYQDKHPSYKGVKLCKEWKDKQKFIDWVEENYYSIDGVRMDLDKDILVKGNKIYSPETCMFVPHIINSYFERLVKKPVYVQSLDAWTISIYIEGKNIELGAFETEEDAKLAYIMHKEAAILHLADVYKDDIPEKLYQVMVNYEIELSDWEH